MQVWSSFQGWTNCSLPGSSIRGILQARILEWGAISFSRRSSWPRDWTRVSHIAGRHFTLWTTRGAQTNIAFVVAPQSLSHLTLCDPLDCSMPGFPVLHYLLEFAQTQTHPLSQWCHPTISSSAVPFSSCPQPFPASGYFPESQLLASMAKVLEIHFIRSISPPNEYSGLISFRIGWFDLLAIQGTLKSLLSSKA